MSVISNAKSIWVSNSTELSAAIANAQAGSVIYLNPGDYGDVSVNKKSFAGTVTIKSADATNPAVFDTLYVAYSSNVTFSDVVVHLEPTTTTTIYTEAVRIISSSGIRIENSEISGGKAISGVPIETERGGLDSTGNVIGLPTGRGINIYGSNNIVLDNNEISSFHRGLVMTNAENVKVTNNQIHDLRISPIAGSNVNHVEISGNHTYNFTPWQFGGTGDHGDLVHFWTSPTAQTGPSTDIKITNNFFDQGTGQALLGIYLDDNGNGLGFTNVTIQDNIIHNDNRAGILLEYVRDSVISHNTLIQPSTGNDFRNAPGIRMTSGSDRLTITDNIFSGITKAADTGSVTESNNLILQRQDPIAANYYGKYFINALMPTNPELSDLLALRGGEIERLKVGASATWYDSTPNALTAIGTSSEDAADRNLYHFDASLSAMPSGQLSTSQAKFVWDFGDGTQATGMTANHRYDAPGLYKATLTVIQNDGTTDTAHTMVKVFDPLLLNINFDNGDLTDRSSYHSPLSYPSSGSTVLQSQTGGAYKLTATNDFQVVGPSARQIFNLDDFTFNFSLKRDSVTDGTGDLFRVHTSWKVSLLKSGELSFTITNDAGKAFSVTTSGARITDTNWHNVSLVLNGDSHTATFFVDGNKVGSGTVTGTTQNYISWGLHVGNLWGDNFHGLLDNVSLNADPFSDAAVKQLHQSNFTTLSSVVADTSLTASATTSTTVASQTVSVEPVATSQPVASEPVSTSTTSSTLATTPTSTSTSPSTSTSASTSPSLPSTDLADLSAYLRYAQIFSKYEIKVPVADSKIAIPDPVPSPAFKTVDMAAFGSSSPAVADFSALQGVDQAHLQFLAGVHLF